MVRAVTEAKYVLARGKWPTRSVRCPMHPSSAPPKVGIDERTLMRDHTKTLAVTVALLVAGGAAGCTSCNEQRHGDRESLGVITHESPFVDSDFRRGGR